MKTIALAAASLLAAGSGFAATNNLEPIPAPSYSPPAAAVPTTPQPYVVPESHVAPIPHVSGPAIPVANIPVKYKDLHRIHPCAVPLTICVETKCGPVLIDVCVPPDCPPDIKERRRKIIYDYGKYEVEIHDRRGYLLVDYDS